MSERTQNGKIEATTYTRYPPPWTGNSVLTFTPTATSGCFCQWTGDLTGFASPGTLTVAGDHAVTAEFGMHSPFELRVLGEGSITLDPPQPPEGYCPGTEVTVTAVPDADWVFAEWGAGLPNLEWAPTQSSSRRQGFLGDGSKATVPDQYSVWGIPEILLIGSNGKIIARDLRGEYIKPTASKTL